MTILLDTSAVVALLERRHAGVVELLRESVQWPTISLITVGELLAGAAMASSPQIAAARRETIRGTAQFQVHPIDQPSMSVYADVRAHGVRGNDALIVTAAVQLDARLVTFDRPLAARAGELTQVVLLE